MTDVTTRERETAQTVAARFLHRAQGWAFLLRVRLERVCRVPIRQIDDRPWRGAHEGPLQDRGTPLFVVVTRGAGGLLGDPLRAAAILSVSQNLSVLSGVWLWLAGGDLVTTLVRLP